MTPPFLCVTVAAATTDELRVRRDEVRDADLVEVRLDSVRDPDVVGALAGRRHPVIVTCRPRWEGGQFDGSEEERRRLLMAALSHGAEYVDLEWRAGFDTMIEERGGRNIVLSLHDFERTPNDLAERCRAMRATGAAVVKLAVQANRLCDLLPLLEIGATASEEGRVVVIGMGQMGLASRLLAARFGSYWAYAGSVAPGQISLTRMLKEFRFRELSATSAVYGVVGNPVWHSVSPAMHNAGFDAIDQDAVYLPLETTDPDDFISFAERLSLRGASVTAPFKESLSARVSDVDDVSRRVGALNTVRLESKHWSGTNTDVAGFLEPLEPRFRLDGARAAVIGAGGAARAAGLALSGSGAQVAIHARDARRAGAVAKLVGGTAHGLVPAAGSWDLLVNATPVGTYPEVNDSPLPGVSLDGRMVYDLVYNPPRTRLLADAEQAGCATLGGLEMLVAQARLQFEWWTGVRPPANLFESVALEQMRESSEQEP